VKEKLREIYKAKLEGNKGALLLNEELDVIKKIGGRELARSVKGSRNKIGAVILDGAASASNIKLCDENGIAFMAATTFSVVEGARVELVSL